MPAYFEKFPYYPALRTRPAEMLGYEKIAEEVKDALLPLVTLGAWPKQPGVLTSLKIAKAAVGNRPYLLDVTSEPKYQNPELLALLSPEGSFNAWRKFVQADPLAIPVIQMPVDLRLPELMRQTRDLAKSAHERIAFRLVNLAADTPRAVAALSTLDSADQALVIVDLGLVAKEMIGKCIVDSVGAINQIRRDIPNAAICVMSSSFPSSVTKSFDKDSGGTRGSIPILERELFEEIGADACLYGDHGSIHPKVSAASGGRYTPRIDYPTAESWEFERRPDTDAQGYVATAKALLNSFPEIRRNESWGAQKIVSAAAGLIDKMKTPSSWIAARVNMHITRQYYLSLASSLPADDDSLEE
ncbi:beta family protein [Paraburkholderia bryophila]|uniref:beta family protein n=1 Tax=Paraburkholderia bryophila TaxID=420952 RepID=UPI00234B43B3|nr:beta family protein [Paraburkholderia bryophila]WCM23358.1 beta family protein [Paraburkholderia bryophila]